MEEYGLVHVGALGQLALGGPFHDLSDALVLAGANEGVHLGIGPAVPYGSAGPQPP